MNEAETQSTLMFGQRVKTIKNNVKANTEKSSEYWMKMYNNECNKGAKIKVLVLKLIKEAKEHRKGKELKNIIFLKNIFPYMVETYKRSGKSFQPLFF